MSPDAGRPHRRTAAGSWGFQKLLEAIADAAHPRHEELTDWLPRDPDEFDPDEATEDMRTPRPVADDWW